MAGGVDRIGQRGGRRTRGRQEERGARLVARGQQRTVTRRNRKDRARSAQIVSPTSPASAIAGCAGLGGHAMLSHARRAVQTVAPRRRAFSSCLDAIGRVGVVGAGQMGMGIAIVSAQVAGRDVTLFDISADQLDSSLKFAEALLQRNVDKGKLTAEQKDATLGRISRTDQLADLSAADFIIEAATENVELKLKLFSDLDQLAKPAAILATNTSSISITKIAAATDRPDAVIGTDSGEY